MQDDEAEIRKLISTWMSATKAGDTETVLSLMADDAVFLLPGQRSIVGKAAFAEAARAMSAPGAPQFDGKSEIQEIRVLGEWAYVWARLTVIVTPPSGGSTMIRAGFTLSVLRKENGRWVLARDANMLSPVGSS
jgi:uncharacterized protein (TIGR02246 family)